MNSVFMPELDKFAVVFVAEPPELFRLKHASHRYTGDPNSMHFKRKQPIGLSGLRPMQPRFNRIETGLPRTKASLQPHNSSPTFNSQKIKHYYKLFQT
jgi:hypothetical protein